MDTTAILDIPFAEPADAIRDYPAVSQSAAELMEDLLGFVPIDGGDTTLGADAAVIDFLGIPADFDHLVAIASVRSNGATQREARLRLNNDSGANYRDQVGAAQTSVLLGFPPTTGSPAGHRSLFIVWLARYKEAVSTTIAALVANANGTGVAGGGGSPGVHSTAVAINRLTFLLNADSYAAGSRVSLYGVKGRS